jgi:hypothetical protein
MLYILNTTGIFTTEKQLFVSYEETDLETARVLAQRGFKSAVGHKSTAKILSDLLEVEVKTSRKQLDMKPGDYVLCFQLKTRPLEGSILTVEQLEELGYKFTYLSIN